MEALSPRSTNIPLKPKPELAAKPSSRNAQIQKPAPIKHHAPPPPPQIREPGVGGEEYETGRFLGKGGFAVCYEGKLARNGRVFAMKVVKSQMQVKKMEEKFRTELQIHSKMRHPNIVMFHRAFLFEKNIYVVLELCPNGSVMDMVKKRRYLSLPEVRRFMVQLCGAIKYLHKRHVAHRDLKMGNLFLDLNMNIKVGDFGLAALMLSERDERRRKTLCGTPNYIAPEVLDKTKGGHNQKVDIWSLGVILFAMLTGFPPFQSKTQEEIYKKVKSLSYAWPSDSDNANYIPNEAKDLVTDCLNLEEEERPDPDQIVDHPFFNMYTGCIPRELEPECRQALPHWIQKEDNPRGDRPSSGYSLDFDPRYKTYIAQLKGSDEKYAICKHIFYTECGVGKTSRGEVRKPVGKRFSKSAFSECLTEEERGLQPVMPLPSNRVYSYYLESTHDWSLDHSASKREPRNENPRTLGDGNESTRSARNASRTQAAAAARAELALAAQLRRSEIQPKSRAAALRQQATLPRQTQHINSHDISPADQIVKERNTIRATANLLSERPIRTRSQTALAYHESLRERKGAPAALLPKSSSTPAELGYANTYSGPKVSSSSLRGISTQPRALAQLFTPPESNTPRDTREAGRIRTARVVSQDLGRKLPESRQNLNVPKEIPEEKKSQTPHHTLGKSATATTSSSKSRSALGMTPLIHPDDEADTMPGTSVREVVRNLQAYVSCFRLHGTQCTPRALRHKRQQNQPDTSSRSHPYVVKWVDYTNRYGIGYVLDDGSVGCVFKAEQGRPASGVVVREGERHIRLKSQAKEHPDGRTMYSEYDQLVPRDGPNVEFYEIGGINPRDSSVGVVRRVCLPSRLFEVKRATASSDGSNKRVAAGVDCTRRNAEKVKRVKLVDQFGKYMIGSLGRGGIEASPDNSTDQFQEGSYVKFYQRLGNVGVWGFGDGAFQFNFPDHTKLVLYMPERGHGNSPSSGSSCRIDFYHLSPSAAHYLTAKGKMHPSGFDTRSVISDAATTFFSALTDDTVIVPGMSNARFRDILDANMFSKKVNFINTVFENWISNKRLGGRVISLTPLTTPSTSMTNSTTSSSLPTTVSKNGSESELSSSDLFWDGTQERSWASSSGGKFVWVTVGAQGGDGEYMSVVLKRRDEMGELQCVGAQEHSDLWERLRSLTLHPAA